MSRLISKNMQALFMPLRLLLKTQLATETLKKWHVLLLDQTYTVILISALGKWRGPTF